jgi:hypothetical protein
MKAELVFAKVPCGPPRLLPEHLEAIKNRNYIPSLKSLAFSQLPTHTVSEVRKNFDSVLGGKTKRNKKSNAKKSKKTSRKFKTRKSNSKRRANKKSIKTRQIIFLLMKKKT